MNYTKYKKTILVASLSTASLLAISTIATAATYYFPADKNLEATTSSEDNEDASYKATATPGAIDSSNTTDTDINAVTDIGSPPRSESEVAVTVNGQDVPIPDRPVSRQVVEDDDTRTTVDVNKNTTNTGNEQNTTTRNSTRIRINSRSNDSAQTQTLQDGGGVTLQYSTR